MYDKLHKNEVCLSGIMLLQIQCKLIISLIIVILILLPGCSVTAPDTIITQPVSSVPSDNVLAQVYKVIDGDTIEVVWEGKTYSVRYIGIDAPEAYPDYKAEPYNKEATAENEQLTGGKTVRLEKDISETDRYGRLLRYVYADGLFVNAEMVKSGYATAATFPPDVKYEKIFLKLQDEARASGKGIWHKN
jgi:endonuclease YncB( thermonuclease family)